jgi:hypothetical protein
MRYHLRNTSGQFFHGGTIVVIAVEPEQPVAPLMQQKKNLYSTALLHLGTEYIIAEPKLMRKLKMENK